MSSQEIEPENINVDLVQALHKKIEALEERVDELESGGASAATVNADPYDQAVLETLQPGQIVTTPQLARSYIDETNIMNKKKAKRRAKALRDGSEFENQGYGEYRYVGGDGDE